MNKEFFPNPGDLKAHLSKYLLKSYNEKLVAAEEVTPDITDWAYANLFGTARRYGGAVATNSAALLGAFKSATREGASPEGGLSFGYVDSGSFDTQVNDISPFQRLSTAHHNDLKELLNAREIKQGSVTVQDIESTEN